MSTETERPHPYHPAEETRREIAALHALLDAQMEAIRDNLEGVHRAIEAAPVAQKAAVETAMAAAEKAVNAALLAAKSAVEQAAIAHAREHELMAEALKQQQAVYQTDKAQANEWRGALSDVASNKANTKDVNDRFDGFDNRVKAVEQELATTRGRTSGQMAMWGVGITILMIVISLSGIVLTHLWK